MSDLSGQWLTLSEVTEMVQGQLHGEDNIITSITTDTRQLHQGQLFVALEGAHFDGHDFIDEHVERLASGVLAHKKIETSLPVIVVDDTLQALTRWATAWRRKVAPMLIAVTGSNGKTTVKQMLSNVLSLVASTCYTHGNLNNHIGVPLTLLTLRKHHRFAVIEMGANDFGEINHLSSIAEPDIAVITNAGPAHLQGFGSVEGVSRAKGEIMNGLAAGNVIVLNADDEYCCAWLDMAKAKSLKTITFGFQEQADMRGKFEGQNTLLLDFNGQQTKVKLPLPGKHNASNALAVAAIAHQLKIDIRTIQQGLQDAENVKGRLQTKKGNTGYVVLDDTYNANPASVYAAISVLCGQSKEPWLVIGDMGELGRDAQQIHADIGRQAKSAGVKKLFAVGELAKYTSDSFGNHGYHFEGHEELSHALLSQVHSNCCVLVKGSRSMHMEDIVDCLVEQELEV